MPTGCQHTLSACPLPPGGSGGAKGRGRQQGQAQAQQSTALAGEELDLAPYEG